MVPERIEREIVIKAPREIVWSVITEPEHVGRWFSDSAAIDLRPGGELILTWDEHGPVYWRVERIDPPRFVSFHWLRGGHDPGDLELSEGNSTLVEFTLEEEGEGTRLRVVESGFDTLFADAAKQEERAEGNRKGWGSELDELREYAERVTV